MAHRIAIRIILVTIVNYQVYNSVFSIIPEFYENYKMKEGQIRSFETPSIQNCIHKCQFDEKCNIANAKISTKIQCVLARIECFEKLHEKMQQVHGWQLYKLPEKHCKARPNEEAKNQANESPTTSNETTTAPKTVTSTKADLCVGGKFYLKHKLKGKCFHYNKAMDRVVLRGACSQAFCETSSNYLYHVGNGMCLKAISNNPNSQIKLSNDCSTNDADFHHQTNNLIFFHNNQLCVWQQQSDNPPENSLLTLRSGCNAQDTGLLFKKIPI